MDEIVKESKLAKKLRLRADNLTEDQKRLADCVKAERAERVSKALAESLARDTLYYKRHGDMLRIDPDEIACAVAETDAKAETERQQVAELMRWKTAIKLRRAFSSVSGEKLTQHAALRMIERNIGIAAVLERTVTVIRKQVKDGNTLIVTTYPKSGMESMQTLIRPNSQK